MRKLKILHIYQSPSYSGAEAYALDIAFNQSERHDVTFLAKASSPLLERAEKLKSSMILATEIQAISISDFDIVVLHSTRELRSLWFRLFLAKLKAKLKKLFNAKLRSPSAPIVLLYTHIWISHSKRDPIHAIPYSVVDEVWCASAQAREALIKFLPLPSAKIKIMRYGRDLQKIKREALTKSEARDALQIPSSALVIGTLARIDKGKGSRELFDAVTDLMQSRAEVHLLMMGPPTDGDPSATTLDQALNTAKEKLTPTIRARVHKLGRVENGTRYLPAFDLFVLATYKENFALTLLEALVTEIPCLATESGGSPDIVRPHSTGWLFLPESTTSLYNSLMTALDQKSKWAEFGANGRRLVETEYDFEKVMQAVDQRMVALVERDHIGPLALVSR